MSNDSTDVLVVGAGPVGLTVAMDLASRGVAVTVVEARPRDEAPSVKCNHISARSMEIFRRLGVAAALREAGLPADYPQDAAYRTSMIGDELTRILIPSREGRRTGAPGPDTDWPTAEPPHRINQIFIEPILRAHADRMGGLTVRYECELASFEEDAGGVTALVRPAGGGEAAPVRARYLIGCDGGRSGVRKAIGAKLEGDAVVQRVQSTYIRAPALLGLMGTEPAWANFSLNPRRSGNVYAIDGRENWLVHNYLREDEADFETPDRDRCIRDILGVDERFEYEVLANEDWFGRRLVADRFRRGRVFLCGDSAHIWVPYAGYGMNAGVADAANLAWLLAAHLAGWAPAAILDAYEAERLPITEQVSRFAMNHAAEMARERAGVPPELEDDTPAGERARAELGRRIYDLNVQQYCCAGLNFGYFYDRSPLVAYDCEAAPGYAMGSFEASTVPGCRLPHVFLRDGRSLYDAIGPDHAVLVLRPGCGEEALVEAAAERGMPLRRVDLTGEDMPPAYQHGLVIARPDQHVAWRGDEAPVDLLALIDRLRGAAAA